MTALPIIERGDYWVAAVKTGFEVYKTGITHSVRVARIGFKGDEGLRRANAEIDRRLALDATAITTGNSNSAST